VINHENKPREIEKNNPEKELTKKREKDLSYHKTKLSNQKYGYCEKLSFNYFIAM